MVDVLSMFIGFVVGVVAAGFAVELGLKKLFRPPENTKLTRVWSLNEFGQPLVSATRIELVKVPARGRVVTAHEYGGSREGITLRTNQETSGNFVVDAKHNRALIFLDDIRPGALALWTVEEPLIERLRSEFNRLWTRSTDYVEKVKLSAVPQKANFTIETLGTVEDVVPYKENYLMRLRDDGETVGVLTPRKLSLTGSRVSVTGIVKTSSTGYPLIEAIEVRRLAA